MKKYLFFIILLIYFNNLYAINKINIDSLKYVVNVLSAKITKQKNVEDSLRRIISQNNVTFDIKDWEEKKEIFSNKDNVLIKNGALFVGILALILTIITTKMNNKASKERELEKFKREADEKKNIELKELVAQFIKYATQINLHLNKTIFDLLDDIDLNNKVIKDLEDKIFDVYYSIKVSLDASIKQKELEKLIDEYINTFIKYERGVTNRNTYEQPIGKLYHKIKAIIHPNYIEPYEM